MRIPNLILASILALGGAARADADTVALRGSARVAPGAPVTLADIAELDGDAARRLGAVEIARGSDTAFEIAISAVRTKLAAAGAPEATMRFRGDRVVVRPLRGAPDDATPAGKSADKAGAKPRATVAAAAQVTIDPALHVGQATPLGTMCELLRNAFGDDAAAVRLLLGPADVAKLEPRAGLRYEITPRSALKADFVSFEIVGLEGDRAVSRERVRVSVRLARDVAVVQAASRRGTSLDAGDYTVERRDVPPSLAARAVDPASIAGTSLARSLDAGVVIGADDIARPATIRRNDRVVVRREIGLVAIELDAIALEDGRLGDRIELQLTAAARDRASRAGRSAKDRAANEPRTLTAEVIGNGRAVVR